MQMTDEEFIQYFFDDLDKRILGTHQHAPTTKEEIYSLRQFKEELLVRAEDNPSKFVKDVVREIERIAKERK